MSKIFTMTTILEECVWLDPYDKKGCSVIILQIDSISGARATVQTQLRRQPIVGPRHGFQRIV